MLRLPLVFCKNSTISWLRNTAVVRQTGGLINRLLVDLLNDVTSCESRRLYYSHVHNSAPLRTLSPYVLRNSFSVAAYIPVIIAHFISPVLSPAQQGTVHYVHSTLMGTYASLLCGRLVVWKITRSYPLPVRNLD